MHTEATSVGSTSPRHGWHHPEESVSASAQQHGPLQQACTAGAWELVGHERQGLVVQGHVQASQAKLAGQEDASGILDSLEPEPGCVHKETTSTCRVGQLAPH